MISTRAYMPTIVLSRASAGGDREKPELTALIHGLEESMKSAIEATGARVISVDGFTASDVEAALNQATERELPILAICRGMHIVNVARGGTLIQHLEPSTVVHSGSGVDAMVDHDVALEPSSELAGLFGQQTMTIRSGHHQAVDAIGSGLRAAGRAADGVIEALESTNPAHSLIGVQWHPEDSESNADDRARLFGWLSAKAVEFRELRAGAAVS
ncbi:gamma-glutamyl-gamma-aminobutyrate hydrolase family protein [Rhodoglobus aureus]|uniref:Glutamine amidotransferase n=1 Tax=Rhodoglobus aureus TaxID=191497 RepID=A0ABN1VPZ7_9MICO